MKLGNVVFVGQGPNQEAWKRGLKLGERVEHWAADRNLPPGKIEKTAEKYCAQIALTGSCGKKLGQMLDMSVAEFFRVAERKNLNHRWNGKVGKGDKFDLEEGQRNAAALLIDFPSARFVCLGKKVAICFGLTNEPDFLDIIEAPGGRQAFLVFPHPSGINTFWNDPEKAELARLKLRVFCRG